MVLEEREQLKHPVDDETTDYERNAKLQKTITSVDECDHAIGKSTKSLLSHCGDTDIVGEFDDFEPAIGKSTESLLSHGDDTNIVVKLTESQLRHSVSVVETNHDFGKSTKSTLCHIVDHNSYEPSTNSSLGLSVTPYRQNTSINVMKSCHLGQLFSLVSESSLSISQSLDIDMLLSTKNCRGTRSLFIPSTLNSTCLTFMKIDINCRVKYDPNVGIPVFLECNHFPRGSLKDRGRDLLVMFSDPGKTSFRLGILEGINYNVKRMDGKNVCGVVTVYEWIGGYNLCQHTQEVVPDIFLAETFDELVCQPSPKLKKRNLYLGDADKDFDMYFLNYCLGCKWMNTKSSTDVVVNDIDGCIQQSLHGEYSDSWLLFVHFSG